MHSPFEEDGTCMLQATPTLVLKITRLGEDETSYGGELAPWSLCPIMDEQSDGNSQIPPYS
jgi:hypothetical protein